MRVIELQKKVKITKPKAEVEAMLKAQRKDDEKLVEGVFEFIEAGDGLFSFDYRFYPGDQIQTVHIVHGETCTIPMGLIRHLNGTKRKIAFYDNVEQNQTGAVKPIPKYTRISRLKFTPSEFL